MSSWASRLDAIPRLGLVKEPTPLTFARRLSAAYGGPQLLFKRDDLLRLVACAASRPPIETLARARKLAAEAAAIIGCTFDRDVEIFANDGFVGAGYGIPSAEGQSAVAATVRAEGVFLDPTYTCKAMAGYLQLLSKGRYSRVESAPFLHTGGAPSLFTASVEAML